jgi:hypothetical protein
MRLVLKIGDWGSATGEGVGILGMGLMMEMFFFFGVLWGVDRSWVGEKMVVRRGVGGKGSLCEGG